MNENELGGPLFPRTCRERDDYDKCGCACPYAHFPSLKLGEQIVACVANWHQKSRELFYGFGSWEYSIAQRNREYPWLPELEHLPEVSGIALDYTYAGNRTRTYALKPIDAVPAPEKERVRLLQTQLANAWENMAQ